MTLLTFSAPVLLVGAGPATLEDFTLARSHTAHVVAVDGGYDRLAEWGAAPDAVIGDMDSIRTSVPAAVQTFQVDEQESTDLEKALRSIESPAIVGIGFLGGRLDHSLAAMHALVGQDARAVLMGEEDVVFAAPTEWRATLEVGTRVSFYPVRRVQAVGSKGLRWPLDGLLFEGGRAIGVSNEAVGADVAAWFAERGVVTILPRGCLPEAIASIQA